MTLSEIFKGLPPEMVFKSHVSGRELTAKEWDEELMNDPSEAKIHDSSYNYGLKSRKVIFFPGVGPAFTECKY